MCCQRDVLRIELILCTADNLSAISTVWFSLLVATIAGHVCFALHPLSALSLFLTLMLCTMTMLAQSLIFLSTVCMQAGLPIRLATSIPALNADDTA